MSALTTIARGDGSRIVDGQRTVVRSASDWAALWAAHAGPGSEAPAVDFATSIVAAAFAGEKPTPGYQIEVVQRGDDGTLGVEEHAPAAGAVAAQLMVAPFHIVLVPRSAGDVHFEPRARAAGTGSAPPPRIDAPRSVPSTTGLDPTVAAALSYLAGPFSAAVILAAERTNPYVRFHAWQSVFALGGLGVLATALLVMAFLALFVSPVGFIILYWSAAVAALLCFATLVVCVGAAFTGRALRLPLVAGFAERRATRG